MFSALDIPLLALLPVLLAASGFFSGSETALFSLGGAERASLKRSGGLAGRTVEALLAEPRKLLITVLLGNMTINVLYFVASSILIMRAEAGVLERVGLGAISLVLIVLIGEVLPKLLANTHRIRFATLTGPPLLALHRVITPLRNTIDAAVVEPLSRLSAPRAAPPQLSREELAALIAISGQAGVIDSEEQRILQDVITLGQLRVRDVMTPRVRIAAVDASAGRADVEAVLDTNTHTNLPVYEGSLDTVVGLLQTRPYLLAPPDRPVCDFTVPARYVPELATLDQLLAHFRSTVTEVAIVVDEYGGTAGIVSLEDVVEEIVGDIATDEERGPADPMLIGHSRWRVAGDMSVHEWAEAFGQPLVSPRVATLGGLVTSRLGRAPRVGDTVELGNVLIEVEAVDRARVVSAIVTLTGEEGP